MTNEEFRGWMARHKLTDLGAAMALGLSISSVQAYRRGRRYDRAAPVVVPDRVVEAMRNYAPEL